MSAPAARLVAPIGVLLCCHGGAQAALSRAAQTDARAADARAADARGADASGDDIAASQADPAQLCRAAIAASERNTRIPDAFLSAMGRIESGRASGGTLSPWPWTVNAAGQGHFYPTKQAAIAAVRQFQAAGIRSVDVGCLQVNLFYHPEAFASLDQAFDPAANAAFAAKLLLDLFAATGSWPRAAAAYHSLTPALGLAYQQKVLEQWAVPDHRSGNDLQAGRQTGGEWRRTARLSMKAHEKLAILPAEEAHGPEMTAASAPPAASFGAPAPALGFNRRFMLPAHQLAVGRSLAAYRTMPVQLAWRQAGPAGAASR
jgi:hypothetical protein